jgi:hypothetical protein
VCATLLELAAEATCRRIDSIPSLDRLPPDLSQLVFDQLVQQRRLTYSRLARFGADGVVVRTRIE